MPEVIDWGEKFRQLGSDVSNAITEPVKVRLQMAVMNREKEKEDKITAAKEKAAVAIGKKYGETGQAFYEAGDFGEFVKLREMDIKASRGGGGGGGGGSGKGGNKYMEQFLLAQQMTTELGKQQLQAQEAVDKARQSGDMQAFESAMENFNAIHDSSMKVKMFIGSFTDEGRKATAGALMKDLDNTLSGYDDAKLDAIQQTVTGQITQSKALSSSVMTNLENTKDAYGLKIDLSGVPSDAALSKYMMAAVSKGEMSMDNAKLIQSASDYKSLAAIANDDSIPMAVRNAAGAKFKRVTTFEAMFPDGKDKLKNASDSQLLNLASKEGDTPEDKAKSVAATNELKERGRFTEPKLNPKSPRKQMMPGKGEDAKKTKSVIAKEKEHIESLKKNKGGRGVPAALKAAQDRLTAAQQALQEEGYEDTESDPFGDDE